MASLWDTVYTFAVLEGTLFVDEETLPKTYNKLQVDMASLWNTLYTFAVPEGILFVDEENLPKTYNKLSS